VSAYDKDGTVRVPGVARCVVGTKQDRATPNEAGSGQALSIG